MRKLTPEFMSYTIAKMGLWAMTQTTARALAPDVRVNAIGPGPTLIGARQSNEHFENQRKNTVLGRGSNPKISVPLWGIFGCSGRHRAINLRRWRPTFGLANARCPWRGIVRAKVVRQKVVPSVK